MPVEKEIITNIQKKFRRFGISRLVKQSDEFVKRWQDGRDYEERFPILCPNGDYWTHFGNTWEKESKKIRTGRRYQKGSWKNQRKSGNIVIKMIKVNFVDDSLIEIIVKWISNLTVLINCFNVSVT